MLTFVLIVGCPAVVPPNGNGTMDADGDGVPDGQDVCPGFDDSADADGDGVPDGCDACEGFPDGVDSDGDGVADGCDLCAGFDDGEDADGDGIPDECDVCTGSNDLIDRDGDGVPDGCDACPGFDDDSDADGDGIADGCDFDTGFGSDDLIPFATVEGTGEAADFRALTVGDRIVISLPELEGTGDDGCECSWVIEPESRGSFEPPDACTTVFVVEQAGDAVIVGLETCGALQDGFAQGVRAGFSPAGILLKAVVAVEPPRDPETCSAEADTCVTSGSSVKLDGRGSQGADGSGAGTAKLAFRWLQSDGPAVALLDPSDPASGRCCDPAGGGALAECVDLTICHLPEVVFQAPEVTTPVDVMFELVLEAPEGSDTANATIRIVEPPEGEGDTLPDPCASVTCESGEVCVGGVCVILCSGDADCSSGRPLCDTARGMCVECLGDGDCDNGAFCDGRERCVDSSCQSGVAPCDAADCDEVSDICRCTRDADCDDVLTCTVDACDIGTGICTHTPTDDLCDDSRTCTLDRCDPAEGDAVTGCVFVPDDSQCIDSATCTTDLCDPFHFRADDVSGCVFVSNHSSCDDGIVCTINACSPGSDGADPGTGCVFIPFDNYCDDYDPCTEDACEPTSAEADGSGCTHTLLDPSCDAPLFVDDDPEAFNDSDTSNDPDYDPDAPVGTRRNPYRRIQTAVDAAMPGDTVVVRGGTYSTGTANQNVVILDVPADHGGEEGRPLTIKAADGEHVILDGTAHGSDSRILVIISGSHVVLEGMEMRNARRTAVDVNAPAHHVTVRLCDVHHNNRDTSFIGGALRGVGPIRHVVFEDCLSHHNSVGIELRESPTQVNSTAHVPPTAGNTGFATDLPESEWDSWEGWTEYAARYCTVRRCVVYDNRLLDEHSDGIMMRYAIDTVFEDNLSFYNGDDNIDGLAATRCVFRGNIAFGANPENTVDGDGNGIKVGVRGGLDNVVARNIAFDNPRGGIDLADTERAEVYNNTVYNNGEWFGIWFEGTRAQVGGMRVLNNVCKHNGTLAGRSDIGVLGGVRLEVYDYNCVSDDTSGNFAPDPGPHGYASTDPGFLNEALVIDTSFPSGLTIPERLAFIRDQVVEKLSLSPGSPAIDRGVAIPGTTDGFHGTAPDLGAIESQ